MHTISYSPGVARLPAELKPWHSETLQRKGHPAIWRDGVLLEEACLWLNGAIVPRGNSPKTWEVAARALVSWLDFLEAADLNWRSATTDDLVAYKHAYEAAVSPQTGREYSAGTIRVRMTYIIDFISFAVAQAWIDTDLRAGPGERSEARRDRPIDTDMLAHLRRGVLPTAEGANATSVRLSRLKPKAGQVDKVHVLTREELRALINWAGPRPSERGFGNEGGSDRDYVLLALGWAVGLRLQGIAGLKVFPFLEISPDPHNLARAFKVTVIEKGQKTRQVDFPSWLVQDVQAYIEGERRRALRKRGPNAKESALLLNTEHSSRSGRAMTTSAMQAFIKRACKETGLMKTVERSDPLIGSSSHAHVAKYSMHCLRHTYAVMTFHNHVKSGYSDLDGWKYIQMQLGHKYPSTTINTYLNHVSVWSNYRMGRILLEMVR